MQRTYAGSVAKTLARSPRSGNTPWLCVHTVSLPSRHCATAHEGPIEPCTWNGRVYVAFRILAGATALAEVFSLTTESTALAFVIRCSYKASPEAGNDSLSFHFADRLSARRALIACS